MSASAVPGRRPIGFLPGAVAEVHPAAEPQAGAKTLTLADVVLEGVQVRMLRQVLAILDEAKPAIERQLDSMSSGFGRKPFSPADRAEYVRATAERQERERIRAVPRDPQNSPVVAAMDVLIGLLKTEVTPLEDGAFELRAIIRLGAAR